MRHGTHAQNLPPHPPPHHDHTTALFPPFLTQHTPKTESPTMADPNAFHALPGDDPAAATNATQPLPEEVKEEYLHPCCQKELESARVRTKLMTKLRAADITRHAMERRQGVIGGMEELGGGHRHEHGAGCCALMVDYPALAELRQARGGGGGGGRGDGGRQEEEEVVVAAVPYADAAEEEEEEEEDSDDELLRELEAEDEGGFMEIRRAEMVRKAQEAAELRHLGVGLHTDLPPTHVLDLVHLRCCSLVVHCYDPHAPVSAALDLCLEGT